MRVRLALTSLILLAIAATVRAQDDELPPDEVADLVERYVERGTESLREGSYEEARLRFEKALKRQPGHVGAHLGIASCHRAVGAYEKSARVLRALLEKRPGDRAARTALAELDLLHGRTAAARKALRGVISDGGEGPDPTGLRARTLLAEALAHDGRRDEARTALEEIVEHYQRRHEALAQAAFESDQLRHEPERAWPLSEEMTLIARGLRIYVSLSPLDYDFANNANELLEFARELDRDNWEAWIEWVRVTRVERYRAVGRARKAFAIVEARNPELADLYTEVAKSVLIAFNEAEGRQLAETALRVNPRQVDARAIAARVLLEDNQYADAEDHIEAGLAVNPRHRDLLALRATLRLLLGDREGFESGMKEVLAVDPTYGEGFHLAGVVVASRQRRYDRGVELVRRGLKLDPMNFEAHASLGIFLANLGRAEEARDALVKSREMFPFSHPVRDNFKTVLDYVIASTTEMRTEHFVYRFDPGEYEILHRFLPELLEECWADMVERYGFTPKAPVLIEVFRKADDFSVRTLGLPGIPALGACFGGLITLDSPQALPPGQFLWASTARHEFGHVMSLQLSEGQVPRWFTEGLSVLEERPLDTGWGKEERFEREVYDAWATQSLPPIATFDALFRSSRVAYAYYVGGLMLAFLEQRSGEKGIVEALRLFGKDRPVDEVFSKAFGLKLAEFDRLFAEYVGERVRSYRIVPNYNVILDDLLAKSIEKPDDGETRIKLAWAYFQQRKYIDAGAHLDRARGGLPEDHPGALLLHASLSYRAGRREKAKQLIEAFFAAGGEDYDARMMMASFLTAPEDADRFVAEMEQAKRDWPVRVSGTNTYTLLRRHYLATGQEERALKELEQRSRIASKDIGTRLLLAREYAKRGRAEDGRRVLEEALRITVFDARVHSLLLPLYRESGDGKRAIRAARCRVALRSEEDSDGTIADRWLDLAEVLKENGEEEEARKAIAEARRLVDPEEVPRIRELEDGLGQ